MRTFIIAELGINHDGDPSLCKEMVLAAKRCGADAVKLQINNPKNISSDPWLINVQEKTRLTLGQMQEIAEFASEHDIELFSSVGDTTALDDFMKLGFRRIKISSSNLLNAQLHERVSVLGIPVILSVGDADIGSIQKVVGIYLKQNAEIALLHCVPQYPTPIESSALGSIEYLKQVSGKVIGFSDHTIGYKAASLAVAAGAEIVEKHFTMDKKREGPDHGFSADPDEFLALVREIRETERIMGDPGELYSVSGDRTRSLVRRAIVFRTTLQAGYRIQESDMLIARPRRQVREAINPLDYRMVIGEVLIREIKPFEALTHNHIGS